MIDCNSFFDLRNSGNDLTYILLLEHRLEVFVMRDSFYQKYLTSIFKFYFISGDEFCKFSFIESSFYGFFSAEELRSVRFLDIECCFHLVFLFTFKSVNSAFLYTFFISNDWVMHFYYFYSGEISCWYILNIVFKWAIFNIIFDFFFQCFSLLRKGEKISDLIFLCFLSWYSYSCFFISKKLWEIRFSRINVPISRF